MGTTISPLINAGPDDEGYGPKFPRVTGQIAYLRESRGASIPKPKVEPKKFMKAAEGKSMRKKPSVKKGKKPENLRASEAKNQKRGAFGEKYSAPKGNSGKGVRVTESFRGRMRRFRRSVEKAPPGWEGTVKAMKKHGDIDNPWALAWSMKNKGDKSHYDESERDRSESGLTA